MSGDKTPGEFMVAIFALVGELLVQPCGQMVSAATLRLRQTMRCLLQFVRVGNLLARREREEGMKAGINAYGAISRVRNTVRLGVDTQTQIPPRSTLDETPTLEASRGKGLRVETDRAKAGNMDARVLRWLEGIRKGMLVSRLRRPLSFGFFANFL
jgi:hypothetical protein